MPPLDPKTLATGDAEAPTTTTNDRKIAADSDAPPHPLYPSDYPAESYYLSKQDELDWFDRNVFFERKASTKGTTSPTSTSKRYLSFKAKASLIGLGNYRDRDSNHRHRRHCKPSAASAAKFFPKRSRSLGKSQLPLSEPTSPKVSCIGRVRSKKDRSRKLRLQLKKIESEQRPEKKTAGLWRTLKAALNLGKSRQQKDAKTSPEEMMATATNDRCKEWVNESANELVGLGGLKRFTSGRRADSWGGYDLENDMENDVVTEGYDLADERSVWSRRGVGPIAEVRCDRDWEDVGPASV